MKTILSALVAAAVLATAVAPASATFKGDNSGRVWKEIEKNLP
jgi:hypothetical protein